MGRVFWGVCMFGGLWCSPPLKLWSLGAQAGGNCGPSKVEWRSKRATSAEAALDGNPLEAQALVAALEQLQHDIAPATDKGARAKACTGHASTPCCSPPLMALTKGH